MRGTRSIALLLGVAAGASACRRSSHGPAPCSRQVEHLCLIQRVVGTAEGGDLGFRFGPPLDANGDGVGDIAAGARFTRFPEAPHDNVGTASVWSGISGSPLLYWRGMVPHGLFGHAVTLIPDLDGDGLADVIVAAPTARPDDGPPKGFLYARSAMSGRLLWTTSGQPGDSFGWDLAIAGDQDRDGYQDLFVGAPGGTVGAVYLVSGKDGSTIQIYRSSAERDSFGWYVVTVPDLDADGRDDLAVGAPLAAPLGKRLAGRAFILSSASGATLLAFDGRDEYAQTGEMLAALPDITGDGVAELAVSATYTQAAPGSRYGQVFVLSGADGQTVHHLRATTELDLFGRMLSRAGDYDGDGVEDLAVGAPWHQARGMARAGRMEVRSGRTGQVLVEIEGDAPDRWLGWHIEYAANLGRDHEPGLVVSLNRSQENGVLGAGALEVWSYRR